MAPNAGLLSATMASTLLQSIKHADQPFNYAVKVPHRRSQVTHSPTKFVVAISPIGRVGYCGPLQRDGDTKLGMAIPVVSKSRADC
jgi:hypothetical protein